MIMQIQSVLSYNPTMSGIPFFIEIYIKRIFPRPPTWFKQCWWRRCCPTPVSADVETKAVRSKRKLDGEGRRTVV